MPYAVAADTTSAGTMAVQLTAAQQAQEVGLPTVAISLYQEILGRPDVDRPAITLSLATAFLDAGRAAEAEQALQAAPGSRPPEWRLRLGLAAAQQKKWDLAREQVEAINVDHLQRPDRAWFWFLQAVIADAAVPRDVSRANHNYDLAQREAPSQMALATFLAAGLRARLALVTYSAADMELARQSYASMEQRGWQQKYQFAETYAVMRWASGGRAEAVRFLQELLVSVPRAERQVIDVLRRLLGMLGDRSRGGAGRNALNQLLEHGGTPEFQHQALLLLAQDSPREPERTLLRTEVDRLLAKTPKSAIYDALLLVRAELALGDSPRDYVTAERRANELKDSFPGSALRPHAFAILTRSAWEQQRFRVAADTARQTREALAAMPAAAAPTQAKVYAQRIAELRVLEAEARFRAQDYRLAADAYAAALRAPPAGIPAGDLMFQRALAAIQADADNPAADLERIVDELAADSRFDAMNRWHAEWSLARGLKRQGRTDAALARVTRLLESSVPGIDPALRARMHWLQLRLSFEAGQPDLTLQLVDQLAGAIAEAEPALRGEITSAALLLRAEAELHTGREAPALETLRKLRADHPASDAAVYSYLSEAEYYAERDKIQNAQTALRALIDNPEYQKSEYVAFALWRMALLSERLGQEKDLVEANQRIEELVKRENAPADLVFAARLRQGDILRTLNQFPQAQYAYEDLVNNPKYARRADRAYAQLRLAECHNAQSSTDPSGSHADQAQSLFEELLYRVSAPRDVRAEAGYNLGKLLERRGQFDKARSVWWTDVIHPFLIETKPDEARAATEPYWLAKTLAALGELLEQRENTDEARRVYVLLRDSKLGHGEDTAVERLQRLGVPGVPAPATKS